MQISYDLKNVLGRTGNEGKFAESARNLGRLQDYYTGPFPCNISRKRVN